MKIYLGADHNGYELKNLVRDHLIHAGFDVKDVGAKTLDPDDDAIEFAHAAARGVLDNDDNLGVLICGTGQGMAMAANRINGIRAALAWDVDTAQASRHDENANVLVLPSRYISQDQATAVLEAWLAAKTTHDTKFLRHLDEMKEEMSD
jgi:ribose 5-phosphate isomerase B